MLRDKFMPYGHRRSLAKPDQETPTAPDNKTVNAGVPVEGNLGETVALTLVPPERPINADVAPLPPEQASPEQAAQPVAGVEQGPQQGPPQAHEGGDIRHAA